MLLKIFSKAVLIHSTKRKITACDYIFSISKYSEWSLCIILPTYFVLSWRKIKAIGVASNLIHSPRSPLRFVLGALRENECGPALELERTSSTGRRRRSVASAAINGYMDLFHRAMRLWKCNAVQFYLRHINVRCFTQSNAWFTWSYW